MEVWAEPGLSVLGLRNPFLELAVGVRPVVQHVLNTIHPLYNIHSRVVQHLLNTTHYLNYKIHSIVVQHVLNTISLLGNNIHSRVVQNVLTTTHPQVTTYILELFNTSSGYKFTTYSLELLNISWTQHTLKQYYYCGSGSGIRCFFDSWIRDPGWIKSKDPDPGWTTWFPIELRNHFLG